MKEAIAVLTLCVMGGTLKAIREKDRKLTMASYAVSLLGVIFVGAVTYSILMHFGVSLYLRIALTMIVGYSADDLLDVATPILVRAICRKLDIEVPGPQNHPRRRREDRENDPA